MLKSAVAYKLFISCWQPSPIVPVLETLSAAAWQKSCFKLVASIFLLQSPVEEMTAILCAKAHVK